MDQQWLSVASKPNHFAGRFESLSVVEQVVFTDYADAGFAVVSVAIEVDLAVVHRDALRGAETFHGESCRVVELGVDVTGGDNGKFVALEWSELGGGGFLGPNCCRMAG